jgi:cyclophilin family peptidyl-prolyl cis-trans isomerase
MKGNMIKSSISIVVGTVIVGCGGGQPVTVASPSSAPVVNASPTLLALADDPWLRPIVPLATAATDDHGGDGDHDNDDFDDNGDDGVSSNQDDGNHLVPLPTADDLVTYVAKLPKRGKLRARFETSKGTINCVLFDKQAPVTVANFVGLATGQKDWEDPNSNQVIQGRRFYDGLIFHRVIPGFMIQGGDPLGVGSGGPGYKFVSEIDADLHHVPGALAMANAGPNTNGSQFFINEVDNSKMLDGSYTVFGQCTELKIVKAIAKVPRNHSDRPNTPVVIKKVTISRR